MQSPSRQRWATGSCRSSRGAKPPFPNLLSKFPTHQLLSHKFQKKKNKSKFQNCPSHTHAHKSTRHSVFRNKALTLADFEIEKFGKKENDEEYLHERSVEFDGGEEERGRARVFHGISRRDSDRHHWRLWLLHHLRCGAVFVMRSSSSSSARKACVLLCLHRLAQRPRLQPFFARLASPLRRRTPQPSPFAGEFRRGLQRSGLHEFLVDFLVLQRSCRCRRRRRGGTE